MISEVCNKLICLIKKAEMLETKRFQQYSKKIIKVSTNESKEILLFLVDAEKRHLSLLKKELETLQKKGKIDLNDLKKINIKFEPSEEDENFEKNINGIVGEINIFKEAINLENSDILFYKKIASEIKDNDGRKLFLILKKQEEIHVNILKNRLFKMQRIGASISTKNTPSILFYNMMKKKK